jgi:hypothetical protein
MLPHTTKIGTAANHIRKRHTKMSFTPKKQCTLAA